VNNPVVIAGDLNITMWSPYYKRFISKTGLRNARQGFGILPSWPVKTTYPHYSKIPPFMSWLISIPIDHCLISPELKVSKIRTGANVNSDHLPLIIDLVIPKEK
jgi:endonuclease/exonuclease/phosphatase family metal-dependent hydrolase